MRSRADVSIAARQERSLTQSILVRLRTAQIEKIAPNCEGMSRGTTTAAGENASGRVVSSSAMPTTIAAEPRDPNELGAASARAPAAAVPALPDLGIVNVLETLALRPGPGEERTGVHHHLEELLTLKNAVEPSFHSLLLTPTGGASTE